MKKIASILAVLLVLGLMATLSGADKKKKKEDEEKKTEQTASLTIEVIRLAATDGSENLKVMVKGSDVTGTALLGHPTKKDFPPNSVTVKTLSGDMHSLLFHVTSMTKEVNLSGTMQKFKRFEKTEVFLDESNRKWEIEEGPQPHLKFTGVAVYGTVTWKEGAWTFQEFDGTTPKRKWKRVE